MNLNKKSVIITGGNTGLGYQCALNIAASDNDWHIVIACRNHEKGIEAVNSLKRATGNTNISTMEIDLASLSSVRDFAESFAMAGLPPLHAVVCNAGLQIINGTEFTTDGFEMTFGVNHLGHFLLVNLLLKVMCEPGRIVFVSSGTHDPDKVTGMPAPVYLNACELAYPDTDLSEESNSHAGRRRYSTSKLCNIYCTYEFAERIQKETGKNITVNAFDPGLMPGTGLARQESPFLFFIWKYIMPVMTLLPINAHTVKKSGRALASLVTDPLLNMVTGRYFEGKKIIKSSVLSYKKENADELWNTSVELVKLSGAETMLSL